MQPSAEGGQPSSKTIADLVPTAAARYGPRTAIRYRRDGSWCDVSYAELDEIVEAIARGLIAAGVAAGERVCILAGTRPEWSYVDLAANSIGAIVVPIYQTNSPEECHWVISDSGACVVVCEDADQLAKLAAVRDRLPNVRLAVVIDPAAHLHEDWPSLPVISLQQLRQRASGVGPEKLSALRSAVRSEDPLTFIYTSGTTGPPKGCVLTHGNYRSIMAMIEQRASLESDADDVVYLYLPLAHSFALLLQLLVFDLGVTLAYFGGDPTQIISELAEVRPTYLPSVPRIFEKIYTLVRANAEPQMIDDAVAVGLAVRDLQRTGEPVPKDLQAHFDEAEEKLFVNVRAAFGGRLREAASGAAPIAKEILEFFFACGVPIMEGYGMTETATSATACTPDDYRFGSVGKPWPGVEVQVAEDGELLIKGPNVFQGYHNSKDASFGALIDGWLHTGDLGRIDEDGFVYVVGRKKDIIITAGGKNLTPANIENDLKRSRWISQAVMHGDRRPYPVALVTLDEEEIAAFAAEHGLAPDVPSLARDPLVRNLIREIVERTNGKYSKAESIKRFAILEHDLSQDAGELTPTLKVKRQVVEHRYKAVLDELYRD